MGNNGSLVHIEQLKQFRFNLDYYRSLAARAVRSMRTEEPQAAVAEYYGITESAVVKYVSGVGLPEIHEALQILGRDCA